MVQYATRIYLIIIIIIIIITFVIICGFSSFAINLVFLNNPYP